MVHRLGGDMRVKEDWERLVLDVGLPLLCLVWILVWLFTQEASC